MKTLATEPAPAAKRLASLPPAAYLPRMALETTLILFKPDAVAKSLVGTVLSRFEKEGFKIEPSCSYVEAAFRRHPEWADLRAELPS